MTNKLPADSPATKHDARCKTIQTQSLVSRIDPLVRPQDASTNRNGTVSIGDAANACFDVPLFTRVTSDSALAPSLQERFIAEIHTLGIGWVSGRKTDQRLISQMVSSGTAGRSRRILPLSIDEPIDVESIQHACAIEFQLYGVPFQALPSSRRARWTPSLPIDISDHEQLAKKVECVRVLSAGRCAVGATVSSGAIYDDVRYLADSGFDYLCLLTDVRFEFSQAGNRHMAPFEHSLELATKAIVDAGTKTKLLVSANLHTAEDMFRCLKHGVTAISVDAYLAQCKPHEAPAPKDTYGSVLSYSAPQVSSLAWVKSALSKLIVEIQDCQTYAG